MSTTVTARGAESDKEACGAQLIYSRRVHRPHWLRPPAVPVMRQNDKTMGIKMQRRQRGSMQCGER